MKRVLVLGHNGLLGNCLMKCLEKEPTLQVETTNLRWPSFDFITYLHEIECEWVINCIARTPQSQSSDYELYSSNLALPIFLASQPSLKVIHPSTNDISGTTAYSISKSLAENILRNFSNVYIIRTSIIGIEEENHRFLLSWFLNSTESKIFGYTNHMWNGITTLSWSEIAMKIILGSVNQNLIVPYSNTVSKYELLLLLKAVFNKDVDIDPVLHKYDFNAAEGVNYFVGDLREQLETLRNFYQAY